MGPVSGRRSLLAGGARLCEREGEYPDTSASSSRSHRTRGGGPLVGGRDLRTESRHVRKGPCFDHDACCGE
ncbi:hypothetical protein BN11_350007 [Nostocoides australiense Ben110]|uniref:Uncharacterized protein n=1 Tax=Nostocoides australiense Ben110 TaxID=1193182 RepID=W6JZ23_9MICO|nr:hypothetical protein BN11_350007 [Tetrasphaera australiensis Ben110]